MIRLDLVSVGLVEDSGTVILVLRPRDEDRLLVVEVGLLEGRAVAMAAEGVDAPRPLTHDLIHLILDQFGARVVEVQIRDFANQTFFANLVLEREPGEQWVIDCRPSDAIALALKYQAPVYATPEVVAKAGVDKTQVMTDLDSDDEDFSETVDDGERTVH